MRRLRMWTCRLGAFGTVLSAMLLVTRAQAEPNLLANPGFEEARQWQGVTIPSNWFVADWEKPRDEDIPGIFVGGGIVSDPVRSGKNSLKLIVGEQEWFKSGNVPVYVMSQYQSGTVLQLPAGKTLDFSFWFYRKDMTGRGDFLVQLHKTGADGTRISTTGGVRVTFSKDDIASEGGPAALITHDQSGWSQVRIKGISVPTGNNSATVALRMSQGKPGQYIYLDDVSLSVGEANTRNASSLLRGPSKKLLYYGWDAPDTKYLRENTELFRKMPFDAVGIKIAIDPKKPTSGDGATANQLGWQLFGPLAFKLADFREVANDLKAVDKSKLELYPAVAIASRDQDRGLTWFDDARWKTIVNNWRVMVSIAKEGGCRGILFDPEHYDYNPELFSYKHHSTERVGKPFAEYAAKARQRGRQLMQAVGPIYPDMTMFCIFAYDLAWSEYQNGRALGDPNGRYGLLPAFMDGMLEGANPRTKWLDAWEFAYTYKERPQFLEAYHTVVNKIPSYGFTKVADLYRSKMRVGFGLMLDYPYGPQGRLPWNTTDVSKNYFSPSDFGRSVQTALNVTDEYVWIYSERVGFFPPRDLPAAYLEAIREAHPKGE